jgi:hypothetical protein
MFYKNKNTPCINRCAQIYELIKNSYISIHDGHGLMMLYDIHMHSDFFNIIINDGLKYITIIFHINTRKAIYILYVCIHLNHVQFLHS